MATMPEVIGIGAKIIMQIQIDGCHILYRPIVRGISMNKWNSPGRRTP